MSSDLHRHTTASDGRLSPEELVDAAKAAGLNYIAITDHDTVDGICQLYEAGLYPAKGIKIIPGIEFSAHHEIHEIHILGYNLDIYDKVLADRLNDVVEARWLRFSTIVQKLQELEYDISEADVLEIAGDSTSISRSHIAQALMKKGFFGSVKEAFDKVLGKGQPAYVSHYLLEPEEIIRKINGIRIQTGRTGPFRLQTERSFAITSDDSPPPARSTVEAFLPWFRIPMAFTGRGQS